MGKPNFFIAGATKSGTTSLWEYLKKNSQVYIREENLSRDTSYFSWRSELLSMDDYMSFFSSASDSHKIICDASATYLDDPRSAKKIYEFNNKAKVLVLLRNPAERAFSLYRWMVMEGYEWAGSFEKALSLEPCRLKKGGGRFFTPNPIQNFSYSTSGFYYEQVKRFKDLFGENLMVVNSDDFKNDFANVYPNICKFLQIDTNEVAPAIYNESKNVVSPKLQFILRKVNDFITLLKVKSGITVYAQSDRDMILKFGLVDSKKEKLNDDTKRGLLKLYKQDLVKLSELLDADYTYWCD